MQMYKEFTEEETHEWYWYTPSISLAERILLHQSKDFLDIGFNNGNSLIFLTLCCDAGSLIGIDVSLSGIHTSRVKFSKYIPGKKVKLVCCSAESLPFKSGTIQNVLCRSVLQYVNLNEIFTELKRVSEKRCSVFILANMDRNPFLFPYRFLRKAIPSTIKNRSISYLSISQIHQYNIVWKEYYHFMTPLIYPFCFLLRKHRTVRNIFDLLVRWEQKLLKRYTFLNKYCWYGCFEIEL